MWYRETMRLWSFPRRGTEPPPAAPDGDALIAQDFLRRNVEDVRAVSEAGVRGHGFVFVGHLRVPASRALEVLEGRLKPYGYTPFISAEDGPTWVHALPLADVVVRARPAINVLLFALTLLSTLAAGSLVAGSLPWLTFDPAPGPLRLLDGLPFAGTLLAILGTHEFGHYFTARAYGASVSLPYFIPGPRGGYQRGRGCGEGADVDVILEAMKMEIRIQASMDGRVRKLLVSQGQTVEREEMLIEIE